jgi:hypothetical protein
MLPHDCDPNEVAPEVVRACFYQALPWTPLSAITIAMKRRQMMTARAKPASGQ